MCCQTQEVGAGSGCRSGRCQMFRARRRSITPSRALNRNNPKPSPDVKFGTFRFSFRPNQSPSSCIAYRLPVHISRQPGEKEEEEEEKSPLIARCTYNEDCLHSGYLQPLWLHWACSGCCFFRMGLGLVWLMKASELTNDRDGSGGERERERERGGGVEEGRGSRVRGWGGGSLAEIQNARMTYTRYYL